MKGRPPVLKTLVAAKGVAPVTIHEMIWPPAV